MLETNGILTPDPRSWQRELHPWGTEPLTPETLLVETPHLNVLLSIREKKSGDRDRHIRTLARQKLVKPLSSADK